MDNFVDNVDNFYSVEVKLLQNCYICYKIYTHFMTHFAYTIYPHSLSGILLIFDAFMYGKTMDNSVVLYTVSYGIVTFFRRIYRTYIRVSVFLHFTEIYRTGVHIIQMKFRFHWYITSKNGDFLWFNS